MELYVINELWEQSRGKHVYCQFRVLDRLTSHQNDCDRQADFKADNLGRGYLKLDINQVMEANYESRLLIRLLS